MRAAPNLRRATDEEVERLRPLLPPARRPLTAEEQTNVDRWKLRLGRRPPTSDDEQAEVERWSVFLGREPAGHETTDA